MRRRFHHLSLQNIIKMAILLSVFSNAITIQRPAVAGWQPATFCTKPPASPSIVSNVQSPSASKQLDLRLLDALIGELAIASAMANLALIESQDPDVRRVALRIAESHVGEIQLLRHWRDSWYPQADRLLIAGNDASHPNRSALCDATTDFDRVFLESMTAQLISVIRAADVARAQATRQELVELAATIVEARSNDIAIMQRMLALRSSSPIAQP